VRSLESLGWRRDAHAGEEAHGAARATNREREIPFEDTGTFGKF
jgi:hypothetical protein